MAPITSKIMLRDYLQETEDAISSGRIADALANCERVLTHFPESLEAQRLLGEAHLAQGNLEDAQQSFDWVLTNDPENVIAYCDRALISERMSDYDTALDCYQQAYELSRGNSQIRREFNQLSTKAGQQGFMFSRAGLARLYMRGDLLSQAIQEWEVVLAATPDRLDARSGLLEAYWREGQRDQVERIASQLLQEVPGCLKALLLLAYVIVPKDMPQARSLLERAEALDPDMVMAQELFADMLASQPADPLLQLLKRPPASLDASDVVAVSVTERPTQESPALNLLEANGLSDGASQPLLPSSGPSSPWGSGDTWGSDVTLIKPRQQGSGDTWGSDVTLIKPPSSTNGSGANWGSDISLLKPSSEASAEPDQAAEPLWDALSRFDAPETASSPQEKYSGQEAARADPSASSEAANADPWNTLAPSSSPQEERRLEPWQMLEEALGRVDELAQDQTNSQLWEDLGDVQHAPAPRLAEAATNYESISIWEDGQDNKDSGSEASNVWGAPAKEQDIPAPPAWLNMLSQEERRQISEPLSPPSHAESERPAAQMPAQPPERLERRETPEDSRPAWAQGLNVAPGAPLDEDEELSFGPAWLKSLGAATLDEESGNAVGELPQPRDPRKTAAEPQTESPHEAWRPAVAEPSHKPAQREEARPEPTHGNWMAQLAESGAKDAHVAKSSQAPEVRETRTEAARESWSAPAAENAEKIEQNLLTTLEELEQGLLSQGFVPLPPKSLSTIANSQDAASALPDMPRPGQVPQPSDNEPRSPLSSALAELRNFAQQPAAQNEPAVMPAPPASAPVKPTSEARWTASFRPVPEPPAPLFEIQPAPERSKAPTNPLPAAKTAAGASQPGQPFRAPSVQPEKTGAPPQPQKPPTAPLAQTNVVPGPVFEPVPAPPSTNERPQETSKVQPPAAPREPLLENELETTMRRPAVRLQPMQQRLMPRDMAASTRGRAEERPAGNAPDGKSSYQERLVWGYQRQLAGDYDNAMQEYRIIIRNAPELIGEVVSNVRALLKLAPKYSAGYRVLGDAYMRQGEYLQAMEAYNKALTMAKRARG